MNNEGYKLGEEKLHEPGEELEVLPYEKISVIPEVQKIFDDFDADTQEFGAEISLAESEGMINQVGVMIHDLCLEFHLTQDGYPESISIYKFSDEGRKELTEEDKKTEVFEIFSRFEEKMMELAK